MVAQGFVIDKMSGAIGADRVRACAHVNEDMWMVEGREGTNAHEFMGTDAHLREAGLVVKMGSGACSHFV